MSNKLVIVEYKSPEIMVLTLNRPEKRNALNVDLMQAILDTLDLAEDDTQMRVLMLKGAGKLFCAGLDLDEAADPVRADLSSQNVFQVLKRLKLSRLVTIALPHASAIAGGAGLVAACDIAVGTPDLKIAFPEVNRGLLPALIAPLLVQQVRSRDLQELFILGNTVTGTRAVEIGLLNRVVPEDRLDETGLQLAKEALEGSPETIRVTKKLLNDLYSKHFDEEMLLVHKMHLDARNSTDAAEGIRAFQEKRKPHWVPA